MSNSIECRSGAVDSVNEFLTSPIDKTEADLVDEVKRALTLAREALTNSEKKALSFKLRFKNGKKAQRRQVISDWNSSQAFRLLGPAPSKKTNYNAVHRRLRKLVDRIESTTVVIRSHQGPGSGKCSSNTSSLGYMARLSAGGHLNLCPKFFLVQEIEGRDSVLNRQIQGEARQAGALTHELCHSLGIFGKGHKEVAGQRSATLISAMRDWANSNAKKARKNPTSYEALITLLCIEIGQQ